MSEIDAELKLYVKEEGERLRKSILGILGGIALLLSILTGFGVYGLATKHTDDLIKEGALAGLEKRAEESVERIRASVNVAEADKDDIAGLKKSILQTYQNFPRVPVSQCKIQVDAKWGGCSPGALPGDVMPTQESSLTPIGGGWSEWSGWQIASDWDGSPWNCTRFRLYCE